MEMKLTAVDHLTYAAEEEDQLSAEDLAAADRMMDDAMAYNLDEVVAEPVRVALSEVVTEMVHSDPDDPKSPLVKRRSRRTTIHVIETYVPMKLFNRMIATRERAVALRSAWRAQAAEDADPTDDPMLGWMLDNVWAVWKETEEDMPRATLETGLHFRQLQGLFARFFIAEARRLRS